MRRPNWPRYLTAWAEVQVGQPFVWGVTDCGQLAAGALEALSGRRPVIPVYDSAAGARSAVEELGGVPAALAAFGLQAGAYAARRPGDLILVPVAAPAFPALFVAVHDRLLGALEGQAVRWILALPQPAAAVAVAWRLPE